jgi:riboflavin synthase
LFTGIIEETGRIRRFEMNGSSGRLEISADKVLQGTKIGDSIALNGICLTAVRITPSGFSADVMAETVRRSSLQHARAGDTVNLERAVMEGGRFGGHLVTGHIDGTGVIKAVRREENAVWYEIAVSPEIWRLVVEKGSIALDGISLTVAKTEPGVFFVSVIPHTIEMTTLKTKRPSDTVNLETDLIGKYVQKLIAPYSVEGTGRGLTMEYLENIQF